MTATKLPINISPCPISEAIVEIRYETDVPSEVVFGLIYDKFRREYPSTQKQPVLQIPEAIRTTDPQLMFLPEYKLMGSGFHLQLGQRSFSVANVGAYAGWKSFSSRIFDAFEVIRSLEVVNVILRLGLRYINTFNFDIFPKSTLAIQMNGTALESAQAQIQVVVPSGQFSNTLRVANNTQIRLQSPSRTFMGSVIDIDTAIGGPINDFFLNMRYLVDGAHMEEKSLFFSLLSNEYLTSLNPEYAEMERSL